ncbi:response regulator [Nitrogeniibacter mangrovi]|uniref:Response regulator n=1 Tax=Nitrogeniibacter mangrovi TaxID=2016596 RepID=A0A6C1B9U2_9RHOO|nr:response regulator [Nitrogeniibacter mangrovi]QID19034.1 response regulator [Nitrogeniibacter mangrovi]
MTTLTPIHHALVVDDDPTFNRVLQRALGHRNIDATGATTESDALDLLRRDPTIDAVILDLNLAGRSGLDLIEPILALRPRARVLVLTGYASIATAVEAVKRGAYQYLAKPTDVETILRAMDGGVGTPAPTVMDIAPMSVNRLEWEHIQRVLAENDGNISATARALKMHRRTLQRKLSKRPRKE